MITTVMIISIVEKNKVKLRMNKMKTKTKKLRQEYIEENEDKIVMEFVSHTFEAVKKFADLAARIVELEKTPHLTINRREWEIPYRAILWSKSPKLNRDLHPSFTGPGRLHPKRTPQSDIFISEAYLRPRGSVEWSGKYFYDSDYDTPEKLLYLLNQRNVSTDPTRNQKFGDWRALKEYELVGTDEFNEYKLGVIPRMKTRDTSLISKIVCEALRKGIPLIGEKKSVEIRQPKYIARVGKTGFVENNFFMLNKKQNFYVVLTEGEFLFDDEDKVIGSFGVPEEKCYCCTDLNFGESHNYEEQLEKTLQGINLTGKKVFFVANNNPSSHIINIMREAFENRGAKVYSTKEKTRNLLEKLWQS